VSALEATNYSTGYFDKEEENNDTTMVSNTAIGPASSDHDVDSIEFISQDSSDTEEDCASPVPEWNDDGDESICGSLDEMENADIDLYEIPRIPSTLEFVYTEEETDSVCDQHPHAASQSSISYSHHNADIIEDGFESHVLPMSSRCRLGRNQSNDTADTSSVRLHSFRRRLNSVADFESIGTNPLSESQSLSTLQTVSASRSVFGRSRQRFMLIIGAMVLVMLSTHDNMKNSRQYYRQQYQLSSEINIRREEIAFPLLQEQFPSDRIETTGVEHAGHESNGHHQAELPKFYFPKVDPATTNRIRGSAGHPGSNLAMARPQKQRPVFVPDTPLPDGGFKKPLERFVFDSQTTREQMEQRRRHGDDSSSWTSWFASLALISIMFDTGWKEYRRYRIASIPSSRDE